MMLNRTVMKPGFIVLIFSVMTAIFVGYLVLGGSDRERNDSDIKLRIRDEPQPARHALHKITTSDGKDITSESSYLKNLKPIQGKDAVVVYNKVGKCGSRTFVSLAEKMAIKNGFKKPRRITDPWNQWLVLEKDVISTIKRAHPPTLLYGHVWYADLDDESDHYVYMNIIRDPLDRLVSDYYYSIFGDNESEVKLKPKYLNETFDQCVLRSRVACTGISSTSTQVHYFCGFDERCKIPSRWTMDKAKRNMDKYLLVGLTEEYKDTLRLLEYLLPQYFNGIVAEYQKPAASKTASQTKTHNKQPPSDRVKEIMQEKLEYEYELYNFAKDRFHRLLRETFQD